MWIRSSSNYDMDGPAPVPPTLGPPGLRHPVEKPKKLKIPNELEGQISTIQGTQKGAFFNEAFERIRETHVRELADELTKESAPISAIIFDGIVTQRLVDLALEHQIKYLIGARLGEVTRLPIKLKVIEFSKG